MAAKLALVPATLQHARSLALRAEDAAEIVALGANPTVEAVDSVRKSDVSFTWLVDGEVACVGGVVAIGDTALVPSRVGLVWLLSGALVAQHPIRFARASRVVLSWLLGHYSLLGNVVDARYAATLRWLRWLHFEVEAAAPLGPLGMPFHACTLRRAKWAS